MGFDFEKYKATDWQPRTEDIPVPELKDFFGEDEKPIWTVRNLTAFEMARVKENVRRNGKAMSDLLAAFAYAAEDEVKGGIIADIKNEMKNQVPGELVLKYELIMAGSVNPKFDNPDSQKADLIILGINHMPVLDRLAETILNLNGQGALPGKQKPCGEIQE